MTWDQAQVKHTCRNIGHTEPEKNAVEGNKRKKRFWWAVIISVHNYSLLFDSFNFFNGSLIIISLHMILAFACDFQPLFLLPLTQSSRTWKIRTASSGCCSLTSAQHPTSVSTMKLIADRESSVCQSHFLCVSAQQPDYGAASFPRLWNASIHHQHFFFSSQNIYSRTQRKGKKQISFQLHPLSLEGLQLVPLQWYEALLRTGVGVGLQSYL